MARVGIQSDGSADNSDKKSDKNLATGMQALRPAGCQWRARHNRGSGGARTMAMERYPTATTSPNQRRVGPSNVEVNDMPEAAVSLSLDGNGLCLCYRQGRLWDRQSDEFHQRQSVAGRRDSRSEGVVEVHRRSIRPTREGLDEMDR